MVHSQVLKLAHETESGWRAANYDESVFDQVAADAFAAVNLSLVPEDVYEMLLHPEPGSWTKEQHRAPGVLTIFDGPDFKIAAHLWLDQMAIPHQHDWCGAFQLTQGRSVNCYHRFNCERRLRADLQIGSLENTGFRIYGPGDIVPVKSGPAFAHSLAYIDRPGMAVSIRSVRRTGEPLTFYKPGLALGTHSRTPLISEKLRCLSILGSVDEAGLVRHLHRLIDSGDWLTCTYALIQVCENNGSLPPTVVARGLAQFGEAFQTLVGAALDIFRYHKVVEIREHAGDHELRVFAAGLYLCRDRNQLLEMLRECFPDRPQELLIGEALVRMLVDDSEAEIPDYLPSGIGALALGFPADDLARRLWGEEPVDAARKQHLAFMNEAFTLMQQTPTYQTLFHTS